MVGQHWLQRLPTTMHRQTPPPTPGNGGTDNAAIRSVVLRITSILYFVLSLYSLCTLRAALGHLCHHDHRGQYRVPPSYRGICAVHDQLQPSVFVPVKSSSLAWPTKKQQTEEKRRAEAGGLSINQSINQSGRKADRIVDGALEILLSVWTLLPFFPIGRGSLAMDNELETMMRWAGRENRYHIRIFAHPPKYSSRDSSRSKTLAFPAQSMQHLHSHYQT